MNNIKKALIIVGLSLTCGAYSSMAQIIVKIRPQRPHIERPAPPSPHHIWIEEEWAPHGNTYEFRGGRWEEPPHPNAVWVPGHWKQTREGQVWIPGKWRSGRGHGHDDHGHNDHGNR